MALADHIAGVRTDTRARAFLRCFLRCYAAGAAFNTRGMLNIGLTFAMQPGLAVIHKDKAEYKKAVRRYVHHFQTHPFWLPCLVGMFLNVEQNIAAGRFPPAVMGKLKDTTSYTLSAIGDSVFAGSLLIFWALMTVCFLLSGWSAAAFALGFIFFLALQGFRIFTFLAGLRMGMGTLEALRKWELIDWGQRIKYANAVLMVWLWALIWPGPIIWWQWMLWVFILIMLGRFVRIGLMSRVLAVAAFLAAADLFPTALRFISEFVG